MNQYQELYSHDLSLKNLIREAENFCYKHDLEYDERKIMIATNYRSNVLIFYEDEKSETDIKTT